MWIFLSSFWCVSWWDYCSCWKCAHGISFSAHVPVGVLCISIPVYRQVYPDPTNVGHVKIKLSFPKSWGKALVHSIFAHKIWKVSFQSFLSYWWIGKQKILPCWKNIVFPLLSCSDMARRMRILWGFLFF